MKLFSCLYPRLILIEKLVSKQDIREPACFHLIAMASKYVTYEVSGEGKKELEDLG